MLLAANPVLEAAQTFWRALPKPVNIPDIRLLDAATIPRIILPHIIIAEVNRGSFDLGRFRLCGHEIVRWFREMRKESPVIIISMARALPMSWVRWKLEPVSGASPRRTNTEMNRASVEAMRMSAARESDRPAPAETPFTAAM